MKTHAYKYQVDLKAIVILAILIACSFYALAASSALAATINVPADQLTIQAAVNAAIPGDTINVAVGTYAGNINVNKSLTILGDPGDGAAGPGPSAPVIDGGSNSGDAFLIANGVSNVTIKGFEMRNFISNDTGIGNGISAWVGSTSNITIQDNYFHNLGYNGVLVGNDKSSNPSKWGDHTNWTIKGNILETFEAYGFELTNASNSSIENNIIHSNATWNLASTCIMVDARRNESGIVIKGNQIDGEMSPGYPAVYVFANSFETPNVNLNDVLIECNTISSTGTQKQVYVYNFPGTGTVTGVHAHNNSLTSLKTNTPATVDATANWWGDNDPSDNVFISGSGSVIYSPWLTAPPCSAPALSLSKSLVEWASYADYTARILSVHYSIGNSGSNNAYDVQIVGSHNTNGASVNSTMPVSLGSIPAGNSAAFILTYIVPNSVVSFNTTLYVTAEDPCQNIHTYPGPYSGV